MKRWHSHFGVSMLTWSVICLGCASESAPGGDGVPDDPGRKSVRDDTGQTGSPGEVECTASSECQDAAALLAELRGPGTFQRTFVGAQCQMLSVQGAQTASGPTCLCATDAVGFIALGPRGLDCVAYGRVGECLARADEFSACTLGDDTPCSAQCAELERRYADDAARTHQASLVHARCENGACRRVLRIDEHCYVDQGYHTGRALDCSLGAEALLDMKEPAAAPPSQPPPSALLKPSAYVPGTLGLVEFGVTVEQAGAERTPPHFYAGAQFFELTGEGPRAGYGEELDPLSGIDDCGIYRKLGPAGQERASPQFFHVDSALLRDGDRVVPVTATAANNEWFSSYAADLSGLSPRYGGTYQFTAEAAKLGGALTIPLVLPERLELTSLADLTRLGQADWSLRWTGRGDTPLRLTMQIDARPDDLSDSTWLECLLSDDGEHVIAKEWLLRLPAGFASASFVRERRSVEGQAPRQLGVVSRATSTHRFTFGP